MKNNEYYGYSELSEEAKTVALNYFKEKVYNEKFYFNDLDFEINKHFNSTHSNIWEKIYQSTGLRLGYENCEKRGHELTLQSCESIDLEKLILEKRGYRLFINSLIEFCYDSMKTDYRLSNFEIKASLSVDNLSVCIYTPDEENNEFLSELKRQTSDLCSLEPYYVKGEKHTWGHYFLQIKDWRMPSEKRRIDTLRYSLIGLKNTEGGLDDNLLSLFHPCDVYYDNVEILELERIFTWAFQKARGYIKNELEEVKRLVVSDEFIIHWHLKQCTPIFFEDGRMDEDNKYSPYRNLINDVTR